MQRRFGRRRTFGRSVMVLGLGTLAVIALIMRRRATRDATEVSYSPAGEHSGETPTSSQEPTQRVQKREREESDELLAQDTEKADGNIREDIRNIIRESIRRSQTVVREAPQAGSLAPEARADAEELPIEDYDSLNVRQVAQRLEGLVIEEIERLRDYEVKNKNRRTLIARFERRIKESPGEDVRILRESSERSGTEYRNT